MNQKQNLILVGVMLFVISLGCRMPNNQQTNTEVSTSPTPVVARTPSEEDKIRDFVSKSKDLCKFETKEKLDSRTKIKGKLALVNDYGSDSCSPGGFSSSNKPEGIESYGIKKEDLALSTDEIDTLIKVDCEEGAQVGVYTVSGYSDIPAYAKNCEVTVADYKNFITFAKKKFVSRQLAKNVKVSLSQTKIVADTPVEQIGKYLMSLKAK